MNERKLINLIAKTNLSKNEKEELFDAVIRLGMDKYNKGYEQGWHDGSLFKDSF